ncbi:MAG: hypothetical protein M3281_00550 [Chloroflexota bacterium]|nr:hypothetical protein [Chloroflexota bacterium]
MPLLLGSTAARPQIDGPNRLAFLLRLGGPYSDHLLLPSEMPPPVTGSLTTHGWNSWATLVGVHAPGCYAIQVDGLNFSEVIVFGALPANTVR